MYIVFGKKTCGFCRAAERLLTEKQIPYSYIGIDEWTREEKDRLISIFPSKTVPIIVKNFTHVGGFEELEKSLSS